ncbi:hypothetical protein ACFLU6_14950, partial [Acidobacteriota bacterium]
MALGNRIRTILGHRRFPVCLVVAALLLTLPSLWIGWQADDYVHRLVMSGNLDEPATSLSWWNLFAFMDGNVQHTRTMKDRGVLPWWTVDTLRIAFWRPLTALSHRLDYSLWPESPVLMHAHSLLWFGALVLVASLLYRRFLSPPWVAGFAALLFALDDARGFPAGWLANRNALLAVFFGLLTLVWYDKWRRDGWRPGLFLALAAMVLALFSGEAALAVCAYLFAHALFLDEKAWPRRLFALLPFALMVLIWFGLYFGLGYGTNGSGYYLDPVTEPLAYGRAALFRAPSCSQRDSSGCLLGDQFGSIPSGFTVLLSDEGRRIQWLVATGFLTLLCVLMRPLFKGNRTAGFFLVGSLLSLLPICATMPHGRLLFF